MDWSIVIEIPKHNISILACTYDLSIIIGIVQGLNASRMSVTFTNTFHAIKIPQFNNLLTTSCYEGFLVVAYFDSKTFIVIKTIDLSDRLLLSKIPKCDFPILASSKNILSAFNDIEWIDASHWGIVCWHSFFRFKIPT